MSDEQTVIAESGGPSAPSARAVGGILAVLLLGGGGIGVDALWDNQSEKIEELEDDLRRHLTVLQAMAVVIEEQGVCQQELTAFHLSGGTGDVLEEIDDCLGTPEMHVERFERLWVDRDRGNP